MWHSCFWADLAPSIVYCLKHTWSVELAAAPNLGLACPKSCPSEAQTLEHARPHCLQDIHRRTTQSMDGGWNDDGGGTEDAAAAEAASQAAALMSDSRRADDQIALMFLPWLIGAAPSEALAVLKVRHQCRATLIDLVGLALTMEFLSLSISSLKHRMGCALQEQALPRCRAGSCHSSQSYSF